MPDRSTYKRILIDATNVNINQPGGGSFCTLAYIEALLAIYPSRVDIMHPQEAHIRDTRYTTIDVPGRNKAQQLVGLVKGQFHRAGSFIIDYLHEHPSTYEYVFLSTGFYAGSIIPKLHRMHIKAIVLHHNYEPEYRMDSHSPLTLGGRTAALVRYWEKKGYMAADYNFFLTQQDLLRFEEEYGKHPHNFVTGVFEPTHEHQTLAKASKENSAVITCALSDIQNQAPLLRFAEQYLPIFRNTLPDWTIQLMGRNPSKAIIEMTQQHACITLTPNPKDLRSLAAQSKLYLCPMDAGGGLKLRIMDGLRAGQPILAHERAARGYDALTDTPFFCTYRDEESFQKGLIQLIQYIQSNTYSRKEVQRRYYELFGLDAGIQRLQTLLEAQS